MVPKSWCCGGRHNVHAYNCDDMSSADDHNNSNANLAGDAVAAVHTARKPAGAVFTSTKVPKRHSRNT